MQERDLQAAASRALLSAEEDEDSAHLVYLGLAAAAFLLLTLFPSGGADHVGGSPKAVAPLSPEGPLRGSGGARCASAPMLRSERIEVYWPATM